MREIIKKLELPKDKYYETHLLIINSILPQSLTPMEAKVLATFMSLDNKEFLYKFSANAKKVVMEKLELKPSGMSNYMGQLEEKGFIYKDDGSKEIIILPLLLPENSEQLYRFKLVNLN